MSTTLLYLVSVFPGILSSFHASVVHILGWGSLCVVDLWLFTALNLREIHLIFFCERQGEKKPRC